VYNDTVVLLVLFIHINKFSKRCYFRNKTRVHDNELIVKTLYLFDVYGLRD